METPNIVAVIVEQYYDRIVKITAPTDVVTYGKRNNADGYEVIFSVNIVRPDGGIEFAANTPVWIHRVRILGGCSTLLFIQK